MSAYAHAQPNASAPYGQGLMGHHQPGVGWSAASLPPIPSPFHLNLDVEHASTATTISGHDDDYNAAQLRDLERYLVELDAPTTTDADIDTDAFDLSHTELHNLNSSHQALVRLPSADNQLQLSFDHAGSDSGFTDALNALIGTISSSQRTEDLYDEYLHPDAAAPPSSQPQPADEVEPTSVPAAPIMTGTVTVPRRKARGLHTDANIRTPAAASRSRAATLVAHSSSSPASAFTSPTVIDDSFPELSVLASPYMSREEYVFPAELHGESTGAGSSTASHIGILNYGDYQFEGDNDNEADEGDDVDPADEYHPSRSSSLSSVPPSRISPPQPPAASSSARPIRNLPSRTAAPRARAPSRNPRTPLPLDAPIQPRHYATETLTSKKLVQNNLIQRLNPEKATRLKRKLAEYRRGESGEAPAGADDDEEDDDEEEDEEDEPPKKKSKGKGKASAKPKPAPKGKGKSKSKRAPSPESSDSELALEEMSKAETKRRKNTMAARESRARKAAELQDLRDRIEVLENALALERQRTEQMRARAEHAEAIMADQVHAGMQAQQGMGMQPWEGMPGMPPAPDPFFHHHQPM